MASKAMIKKLNGQLNKEFYSSNIYLQMSAWCETKGLEGSAAFLKTHANEEMTHMQKFFTYICELGDLAIIGQIDAPPVEFKSLKDMIMMFLSTKNISPNQFMNWLRPPGKKKTIRHTIFCNGLSANNMKRKHLLNRFWINSI